MCAITYPRAPGLVLAVTHHFSILQWSPTDRACGFLRRHPPPIPPPQGGRVRVGVMSIYPPTRKTTGFARG
jgi:hypothetical protein